jgi:hypothetical protein
MSRVRYGFGNIARLLSRPWKERNVTPAEATSIFGCSFGSDGWHHIRRTLAELDASPNLKPFDSTLANFLTNFVPTSVSLLAGIIDEEPLPLFVYPWGTFTSGASFSRKDARLSRFCGPSEARFIDEEFYRTVSLYNAMKAAGYCPMTYPNSFISGTWLEAVDGRRRFVVMQGNHRMAILAHLKYSDVAVRVSSSSLPVVREIEVAKWPLVVSGRCSKDHALSVFNLFFEETGWHVAKLLAQ